MSSSQYMLAWDAYQKNICSGLGALQERGEFVDMTLAADGHYVKVHKMVMSLVSPYIKDLISSADCPHPVIFLNNVSYKTLSLILEYIYTGQVSVSKDGLSDLIQAGKALCINGLVDMVEDCQIGDNEITTIETISNASMEMHDNDSGDNIEETVYLKNVSETEEPLAEKRPARTSKLKSHNISTLKANENNAAPGTKVQYTMSNQGTLQIVLNRYIYNIRYIYKNSNYRMWKCMSYPRQLRCPAYVITENDYIIERRCTHNHPFHDKHILRKVRKGRVFSVLKDVQLQMEIYKRKKATTTPDK